MTGMSIAVLHECPLSNSAKTRFILGVGGILMRSGNLTGEVMLYSKRPPSFYSFFIFRLE
jgi:hypothetical protein